MSLPPRLTRRLAPGPDGARVSWCTVETRDSDGETLDQLAEAFVERCRRGERPSITGLFRITPGGAITAIIDSSGDGFGNMLEGPVGLAIGDSGSAYVAGRLSDNAFKITPDGTITQIIDSFGDGIGVGIDEPHALAVGASDTVYLTGAASNNSSHGLEIAGRARTIPDMEITNSGSVSATATHNRRVISSNSAVSGAAAGESGSRAMPHAGHGPGTSRTTSGCIGQV